MTKKIFITTAIDYANDVIHVGHAYEKILADVYARYYRQKYGAENVLFTTGTDEHGTTNQKAAEDRNLTPLEWVTQISHKDKEEIDSLNVSYDRFIRTTDKDHIEVAQNFFKTALENGDVYKDTYKGYYCEGCESHKTLSELTEDKNCPNHLTRDIQELDEENYFFRWSRYENFLRGIIESNELLVLPEGKRKEMLAFLDSGLKDITISRPRSKVSWGISVPGDEDQVIYVWFDALINYYTEGNTKGFWNNETEILHFVGKDIARWHVLLWPAMLKSVGKNLPSKVYIHGFINLEGQKISKSRGNVIRPTALTQKYGVDAVRYYLLKFGPIVEDSDISISHLEEVYNADLANGLGNAFARVTKLAERSGFEFNLDLMENQDIYSANMDRYRVDLALADIWVKIANLDKYFNENAPWKIEDKNKLKEVLEFSLRELLEIGHLIEPFMPDTSHKLRSTLVSGKIKFGDPLFPRI